MKMKNWWPRLAMLMVALCFIAAVFWVTSPGMFRRY